MSSRTDMAALVCRFLEHRWGFHREVITTWEGQPIRDVMTAQCSRCGERGNVTYEQDGHVAG